MCTKLLFVITSILCFISEASASSITYGVTVNTSSIAGTTGSLDFQFNPGPLATQLGSIQIVNFTSNGTLAGACPCGTGDVNGQLPAILTFDNATVFNDYFDGFKFGNTISFGVSLYGPALTSPDHTSTSGSGFAFSMFSDAAGTIPVLTSDSVNGFAFTVAVNLDGTTTVANSSSQTTISSAPEPSGFTLSAIPIVLLMLSRLWQRNRARLSGVECRAE